MKERNMWAMMAASDGRSGPDFLIFKVPDHECSVRSPAVTTKKSNAFSRDDSIGISEIGHVASLVLLLGTACIRATTRFSLDGRPTHLPLVIRAFRPRLLVASNNYKNWIFQKSKFSVQQIWLLSPTINRFKNLGFLQREKLFFESNLLMFTMFQNKKCQCGKRTGVILIQGLGTTGYSQPGVVARGIASPRRLSVPFGACCWLFAQFIQSLHILDVPRWLIVIHYPFVVGVPAARHVLVDRCVRLQNYSLWTWSNNKTSCIS